MSVLVIAGTIAGACAGSFALVKVLKTRGVSGGVNGKERCLKEWVPEISGSANRVLVSCECRVSGPPICHKLPRKNPHLPGGGPSRVAVPRTICDLRLTMVARSLGKASVLDQEGTLGQVSDSKI